MMVGMARNRSAYNSSDHPVIIDEVGHSLGGREHGLVDPEAPEVLAAVELGVLLLEPEEIVRHPQELVPTPTVETTSSDDVVVAEVAPAAPRPRPSRK